MSAENDAEETSQFASASKDCTSLSINEDNTPAKEGSLTLEYFGTESKYSSEVKPIAIIEEEKENISKEQNKLDISESSSEENELEENREDNVSVPDKEHFQKSSDYPVIASEHSQDSLVIKSIVLSSCSSKGLDESEISLTINNQYLEKLEIESHQANEGKYPHRSVS